MKPSTGWLEEEHGWHWGSVLEDTVLALTDVTMGNVLVVASTLVAMVASPFKTNAGFARIGECAPITANGGQLVWIQQKLCWHKLQLNFFFPSSAVGSCNWVKCHKAGGTAAPHPARRGPRAVAAEPECDWDCVLHWPDIATVNRRWIRWSTAFYLLFPLCMRWHWQGAEGASLLLLLCFCVIGVHPCSGKFLALHRLSGREVQIVPIFPGGGTMRQSNVWPAHITLLAFGTAEYLECRFLNVRPMPYKHRLPFVVCWAQLYGRSNKAAP